MKLALVLPHMFMHDEIFCDAIFAPGHLAIDLAKGLQNLGVEVTFFTPGFNLKGVENINADLSLFEDELKLRGYGFMELLQKHPSIFVTLARQIQAELIAKAYSMANNNEFDLVHIYGNEEELALTFAEFCKKPVVFTHHEPFNFLTKYRSIFPKYKHLNWISISKSQQLSIPRANFVANIYHGIPVDKFSIFNNQSSMVNSELRIKEPYFAYFGRIIESKGVHLAIAAAKRAGVKLKIAGKHYSGFGKEEYWEKKILPELNDDIEYVGFLKTDHEKEEFLGNAKALLVPSIWDEPFGMVMIEALACGTPIIGSDMGAIPEIVEEGKNGRIFNVQSSMYKVKNQTMFHDEKIVDDLVNAINKIDSIKREDCRKSFVKRFTASRMCEEHLEVYKKLLNVNS